VAAQAWYSMHAFKRSAIKRRIAIKRSATLGTQLLFPIQIVMFERRIAVSGAWNWKPGALRLKACILYNDGLKSVHPCPIVCRQPCWCITSDTHGTNLVIKRLGGGGGAPELESRALKVLMKVLVTRACLAMVCHVEVRFWASVASTARTVTSTYPLPICKKVGSRRGVETR